MAWAHGELSAVAPLTEVIAATFAEHLATVDAYLADPGPPTTVGARHLRASAEMLAAVTDATGSEARLADHPLESRRAAGDLYTEPHSPLFDFAATAVGAEWIGEFAEMAQAVRRVGATAVVHMDWAARNVRVRAAGVKAIYDSDSLSFGTEAIGVGQAAVTWADTGESPHPAAALDLAAIEAFLDAYPRSFDRRSARAAALSVLCYSARCEHALDPEGVRRSPLRDRLRVTAPELAATLKRPTR